MPLPLADIQSASPWLEIMRDRIVAHFQPLKIILFGSHARGDANPDSDIDLLVVFQQLSHKRKMAISIRKVLSDLPVAKDIIVTTPKEIDEYGDLIGTVLRPALKEGKTLYEQG
ncbi:MAG: nucleotidyltransferase domain-containing protein [Cyanobacteria bacterium]|nr:nucleotidyltransferase domain-containing protein [Cyanobacteriota bacterium]MDA0867231.1 nucleotidyltransferase domain-containing protein [Cyanobacteriota bacterium]